MNQKVKDLLKWKWYFQGFNGTPGMLYGPTWSAVSNMPNLLLCGYSAIIEFFEEDKCYFLYAWDDLYAICDHLRKKVKEDPNYLNWLLDKTYEISEEVLVYLKQFDDMNLKEKSDKELSELYYNLTINYAKLLTVSHVVEGFTLTTEDKIRKLVQKHTGEKSAEAMKILTAPLWPSFVSVEHNELYKIVKEIKEKGIENFEDNPEIMEKIKDHQKKYFWKNNGYSSAKELQVEDFVKEIKEILNKGIDVDKKIKDFEDIEKNKEKKDKLLHEINDPELTELIEINNIIFRIHDYRKEVMTIYLTYLDMFHNEASKRYNVDVELVRYIKSDELDKVPELKEELKERRKLSLFIFFPDEDYLFTGKEAREYVDELNKARGIQETRIIKGNCASKGKARGIVKVCRGEKEISKMKEGNILVACMTQPEFVPAMKKAAAVITDEGGLTCHAAIVSRELGIPCVIGAKIATNVLKDGDVVEVDADKGEIRKLK